MCSPENQKIYSTEFFHN